LVCVPQSGKLLPDLDKSLLGHVPGEVAVAQDPVRDRMEPIAQRDGQLAKGDSIALSRQLHEFSSHFLTVSCTDPLTRTTRLEQRWFNR
jgi:hypothetical protein